MEPAIIYTLHSGNGMRLLKRSWYVATSPVLLWENYSCDIPDLIADAFG